LITFLAHVRVRQCNSAAFEDLMSYVAAKTYENEPGVLYYEFSRSVQDSELYLVIEVYADAAAHAAHMASAWVTESLPRSAALVEGKPETRQYVSPGAEPVRTRSVYDD